MGTVSEGPCLIFTANRILTTQLQCGNKIYDPVLRQAKKEGVEEVKKILKNGKTRVENAAKEQADRTA